MPKTSYFIQISFVIGASRLILSLGLRTDSTQPLFDAWPLISTMPGFIPQESLAS